MRIKQQIHRWKSLKNSSNLLLSLNCDKKEVTQSPNVLTFKEPKNRFQGIDSVSLSSLAGPYDNPIPTRFLAPKDCSKTPALFQQLELLHF
jgi:hypothetical protein